MGYTTTSLSHKRKFMEGKKTESLVKKRFRAQRSVKKVMLNVFRSMKGSITIDFLEKGSTINSTSKFLVKIHFIDRMILIYIYIYVYIYIWDFDMLKI